MASALDNDEPIFAFTGKSEGMVDVQYVRRGCGAGAVVSSCNNCSAVSRS